MLRLERKWVDTQFLRLRLSILNDMKRNIRDKKRKKKNIPSKILSNDIFGNYKDVFNEKRNNV